jgi:hypothetical protein
VALVAGFFFDADEISQKLASSRENMSGIERA